MQAETADRVRKRKPISSSARGDKEKNLEDVICRIWKAKEQAVRIPKEDPEECSRTDDLFDMSDDDEEEYYAMVKRTRTEVVESVLPISEHQEQDTGRVPREDPDISTAVLNRTDPVTINISDPLSLVEQDIFIDEHEDIGDSEVTNISQYERELAMSATKATRRSTRQKKNKEIFDSSSPPLSISCSSSSSVSATFIDVPPPTLPPEGPVPVGPTKPAVPTDLMSQVDLKEMPKLVQPSLASPAAPKAVSKLIQTSPMGPAKPAASHVETNLADVCRSAKPSLNVMKPAVFTLAKKAKPDAHKRRQPTAPGFYLSKKDPDVSTALLNRPDPVIFNISNEFPSVEQEYIDEHEDVGDAEVADNSQERVTTAAAESERSRMEQEYEEAVKTEHLQFKMIKVGHAPYTDKAMPDHKYGATYDVQLQFGDLLNDSDDGLLEVAAGGMRAETKRAQEYYALYPNVLSQQIRARQFVFAMTKSDFKSCFCLNDEHNVWVLRKESVKDEETRKHILIMRGSQRFFAALKRPDFLEKIKATTLSAKLIVVPEADDAAFLRTTSHTIFDAKHASPSSLRPMAKASAALFALQYEAIRLSEKQLSYAAFPFKDIVYIGVAARRYFDLIRPHKLFSKQFNKQVTPLSLARMQGWVPITKSVTLRRKAADRWYQAFLFADAFYKVNDYTMMEELMEVLFAGMNWACQMRETTVTRIGDVAKWSKAGKKEIWQEFLRLLRISLNTKRHIGSLAFEKKVFAIVDELQKKLKGARRGAQKVKTTTTKAKKLALNNDVIEDSKDNTLH